jgi:hypothetical protein
MVDDDCREDESSRVAENDDTKSFGMEITETEWQKRFPGTNPNSSLQATWFFFKQS